MKKRANLERMAKPLEVHCPNCNTVIYFDLINSNKVITLSKKGGSDGQAV